MRKNMAAHALLYDYQVIIGMATSLPESTRKAQALRTANEIRLAWKLEDECSWDQCRAIAKKFLDVPAQDCHTITAIGILQMYCGVIDC